MSYIEIQSIENLLLLQKETGHNLLKTLIDLYLEQLPTSFQQMQVAMKAQDFTTLRRESHTLKSSSAMLGAMQIQKLCLAIEDETTLSKTPNPVLIEEKLSMLQSLIHPTAEELNVIMQQNL